jgi:hypothetical protein
MCTDIVVTWLRLKLRSWKQIHSIRGFRPPRLSEGARAQRDNGLNATTGSTRHFLPPLYRTPIHAANQPPHIYSRYKLRISILPPFPFCPARFLLLLVRFHPVFVSY